MKVAREGSVSFCIQALPDVCVLAPRHSTGLARVGLFRLLLVYLHYDIDHACSEKVSKERRLVSTDEKVEKEVWPCTMNPRWVPSRGRSADFCEVLRPTTIVLVYDQVTAGEL